MSEKTGKDYPEIAGRTLLGVPVSDLPMDDETAAMLKQGFDRMDDLDRMSWAMSMPSIPDGPSTISWRRFDRLRLIGED